MRGGASTALCQFFIIETHPHPYVKSPDLPLTSPVVQMEKIARKNWSKMHSNLPSKLKEENAANGSDEDLTFKKFNKQCESNAYARF